MDSTTITETVKVEAVVTLPEAATMPAVAQEAALEQETTAAETVTNATTTDTGATIATTTTNFADATTAVDGDAVAAAVSSGKRAARREKRREYFDEKKKKKKLQKKLEKDVKPRAPEKELDMSEEAVLRRRERSIAKREAYLMAAEEGIKVVIDCGFEEDMDPREKKSLSQQIMFSYGANRRSQTPVRYDYPSGLSRLQRVAHVGNVAIVIVIAVVCVCSAYITSLRGETKDNLEKISGFSEWLAFRPSSQCYIDLFKKESLVYLTADSPNTITQLSRDKVYIIGGIVDRNRLKGITYKKAVEQGIETGKLPLDQVVDMGGTTRVLTVNHVFEILIKYAEQHDWARATLAALPGRKNVQLKQE